MGMAFKVNIKEEAHICELLEELENITRRMREIINELSNGGIEVKMEDLKDTSSYYRIGG